MSIYRSTYPRSLLIRVDVVVGSTLLMGSRSAQFNVWLPVPSRGQGTVQRLVAGSERWAGHSSTSGWFRAVGRAESGTVAADWRGPRAWVTVGECCAWCGPLPQSIGGRPFHPSPPAPTTYIQSHLFCRKKKKKKKKDKKKKKSRLGFSAEFRMNDPEVVPVVTMIPTSHRHGHQDRRHVHPPRYVR